MNAQFGRIGLTAAVLAAALSLFVPAREAAAETLGMAVMNTGSEGPVMGCPHTVGVGTNFPGTVQIWVDGMPLTPVRTANYGGGAEATWVPNRLGWHTIEAVQSGPGIPTVNGQLCIEVRRAGINAGSACFANGVPLPINPQTGTL